MVTIAIGIVVLLRLFFLRGTLPDVNAPKSRTYAKYTIIANMYKDRAIFQA